MMSLESHISGKNERIAKEESLMALLNTWHKVPTGDEDNNFNEKLVWCLEHCQSKFRDIKDYDTVIWYFQNEQDATLFAMKWA